MNTLDSKTDISNLYNNIQNLIETAKSNMRVQVNAEITTLYYNIGKTIKEKVLKLENQNMVKL